MTYALPEKPVDPKPRYVEVTDRDEIAAITRGGLGDPIGGRVESEDGEWTVSWFATAHSLAQYRKQAVNFDV
jgi:hypothetical protein